MASPGRGEDVRFRSPRPVAVVLVAGLLSACGPLGASLQAQGQGRATRRTLAPRPHLDLSVRLVDCGTYRTGEVGRGEQPDTLNGSGPVSFDLGLDQPGARVRARLGTSMGFRYVAEGAPEGAVLPVRVVARHPPMTLAGRTLSESSWDDVVWVGQRNRAAWRFEAPFELVAGDWVLEVWQADRLLVRQAFQVEVEQGSALPGGPPPAALSARLRAGRGAGAGRPRGPAGASCASRALVRRWPGPAAR